MAFGFTAASAWADDHGAAVFAAWTNAYLVQQSGDTFICKSFTDRTYPYQWEEAYRVLTVEDAYERFPTKANQDLVSNLLTTFRRKYPDLAGGAYDNWNDNTEWCVIMLIRGYLITGNTDFRDAAKVGWDKVWTYNHDTTDTAATAYGIVESFNADQITAGQYDRCGLSNWPLIIAGCMLYQATDDSSYLDKCKNLYEWARTRCYDPNSGRVYEGWNTGRTSNLNDGKYGDDNSYNSGLIICAANALYRIIGDSKYYNDAMTAANHCVGKYNNSSFGIMNEDHPANGDFGGEWLVRGLSKFSRENGLTNYNSFLQNNSNAAWKWRRAGSSIGNDLTANNFTTQTSATADISSIETGTSVSVQVLTYINPLAGTHVIVNQQNGEAVDTNNASSSTAGVVLYAKSGGPNQRWVFTQNADTSWNIVSARTGLALNNAGSSANGAQVTQFFVNSDDNNQRWWVDKQSDGTYKIWSKPTNQSWDNGSKSGNSIPLLQWSWQNSNNPQQRWNIQ